MTSIHETAEVGPEVELGEDVTVESNVLLKGDVKIGSGSIIGPNCVIKGPVELGEGNEIFTGTVIGSKPQDRSYELDSETGVVIGDSNKIREYVTINKGSANEQTCIGSDNMIMSYSHVGHDCVLGDNIDMANNVNLSGHVTIGDNVVVSGQTGFHQFVRVGDYAMVGGFSRVVKDIVPYCRVSGIPLEVFGPNSVGLKRNGFNSDDRTLIRKILKTLFRDHQNTSRAVEAIEEEYSGNKIVDPLLEFIENSERGIHR